MSASIHTASDTGVSDNSVQSGDKPAMGVGHNVPATQPAPSGSGRPGAPPRGPQGHRLAGKVDLRLSGDLREALRAAAKRRGVTDGAFVRSLVADALGAEASADRESGMRKRQPSPLLAAAGTAVREIGAAHVPLAALKPDVDGVRAALARARAALLPIIREEAADV